MPIVFLSPSTQDWNPYVTGSGSEEYWMSYRAFWQRRCRAAAAGALLKPSGGNCAVLP